VKAGEDRQILYRAVTYFRDKEFSVSDINEKFLRKLARNDGERLIKLDGC